MYVCIFVCSIDALRNMLTREIKYVCKYVCVYLSLDKYTYE